MRKSLIASLLSVTFFATSATAQMPGGYGDPMMGGGYGGGQQQKEQDAKPKPKIYEQIITPKQMAEEDLSAFHAQHKADPNFTLLHYYASLGEEHKSSEALVNGDDANGQDALGNTPLHYAASNGHTDILKLLTVMHADVNTANKEGLTPLYSAALAGHIATMDFLVNAGANVNIEDANGDPLAFHLARVGGNAPALKWLHEKRLNLFKKNSKGESLLQVAKRAEGAKTTYSFLKEVYTESVRNYYKKRGQEVPKGALKF